MAAKTRELRLLLGGDPRSVQRAFATASKAAADYEQKANRQHSAAKVRARESVAANAALTGSFKSMARQAVTAGAGFAGAYIGISKAKNAIHTTEDLAKATIGLHKNLGLSVKVASEWAAVARSRDVDTKALNMSFGTLSKNVVAANQGGKQAADTFKNLGVSVETLKSGDFNRILGEVSDRLKAMPAGPERTATAMKLFGRGWQTLVPVLRDGSKSMREQLALADKYGVTFGGKSLKSMNDLVKSQRELKFAQMGLQVQFTEKIAPGLLKVEHAAEGVARIFSDKRLTSDEKWRKIEKILENLGGKVTDGFEQALPHVMDEAAHMAPKAAGAFIRAWLHAGVWGQLFTVALIARKIGVFGTAGNLAVQAFAKRFVPRMAAAGAAGGTAAAGAEGVVGAAPIGKFRVAGRLAGAAFALGLTAEIVTHAKSIPDAIGHLLMPLSPSGSSGGVKGYKPPPGAAPFKPDKGPLRLQTPKTQAPTHHPHGRAGTARAHTSMSARAAVGSPGVRASGGTVSHSQLASAWVGAGGDPDWADTMAAVALAESGGNLGAHNTNGEDSRGPWQINVGPGANPDLASLALFTLSGNARAAVIVFGRQGAGAWTMYRNGTYKGYLGGKGSPAGGGGGGGGAGGRAGGSKAAPPPVPARFPTRLRGSIGAAQHQFTTVSTRVEGRDRAISQLERVGNFGGAAYVTQGKLQDEKIMRNAAKAALRGYKAELKILRHQLRTAPKGRRSKIAQAINDVLGKIRDLQDSVRQLGFDIGDTKLDLKDELKQGSDAAAQSTADAQSASMDAYQSAISDVDLQVAAGILTPEQGQQAKSAIFGKALGGGFGPLSQHDIWQVMADQRDATQANTDATNALADQLAGVRDELKQLNDFSKGVSAVTSQQAVRALADMISGQITGFGYTGRASTAGSGSVVRY